MITYSYFVAGAAIAGFIASQTPAFAQDTTFRNYHCADGSEFIVGYYPYDSRAYLQIDGGPVTLRRRFSFSGTRYSASGITLKIGGDGRITVKRPLHSETACQVVTGKPT
jgi:membrane-bound inhibitor of C-type lysozyme